MSKVYVGETKNIGKGLFAKFNIKKDEILFIVKGTMQCGSYGEDFYQEGPNWLAIEKNKWISPFDNNPWRYINHSCNPNAGLKGKVTVVAMKNIRKDEPITIDYSMTEDDPHWRMRCNCNERNCRKIIRSVRFLDLKLFNKYKLYVPEFLRKSYMRTNKLIKTQNRNINKNTIFRSGQVI